MQIRKWLALLVSAALALSLLAGCGGKNQSLAQVILDLLDGQYANVTVEIDPDLEADLRQAVHEGETEEEIRAALEKILGSGVSFRLIGDGQQGDSAWNLILYPGNDPDAAARSAFTEWNKVFGSLPRDGQYTAQIAMIETENGYAILVKATVDKAASRDDDDDDDEPEKPYSVNLNTDKELKSVTVNADAGFQHVLFGEGSSAIEDEEEKALAEARNSGFKDVTIELAAGEIYTVSKTFSENNGTFKGILKGKDENNKATINITGGNGLFQQIDSKGRVENITFDVQTEIKNTYAAGSNCFAGAVAGLNNGTIQNCDVTIDAGGSITAANESGSVYAGGIAGENCGMISNCDVEGSYGVEDGSVDIRADGEDHIVCAGGIAGYNHGNGTVDEYCSVSNCKIEAGDYGERIAAGGIVGRKESGNVNCGRATDCYITATANDGSSATVSSDSDEPTDSEGTTAKVYAGAKIGFDDSEGVDGVPVG